MEEVPAERMSYLGHCCQSPLDVHQPARPVKEATPVPKSSSPLLPDRVEPEPT
jgi:hypothetical protein